jgi:nitrogen regulatory protein PII-like uncharacterized protein
MRRIQKTHLTNDEFFSLRIENDPDEDGVHIVQEFGDQDVYVMTLDKEAMVELIYQLTSMLDD